MNTSNFGEYLVKNVKSFQGREGYGYNANLYRGKKKVAFCKDMANGGDVDIDWIVGKIPKNESDYPSEEKYKQAWAEYHQANKEERDLLEAHLATLDHVPSNYEGLSDLEIDAGWFVTDCVSKYEADRDLRKMKKECLTKTLFRKNDTPNKGAYRILKSPCNERARAIILRDFGEDVEIFNDVIANNEIPSVLRA